MAEEYVDAGSGLDVDNIDPSTGYDDEMNSYASAGGDFADGSVADGQGRGDPGRNDEIERLRSDNQRLAERSRMIDQFEANPEGVLRDVARRMGLDLVPSTGQNGREHPSQQNRPPREFEENLASHLPPEMQFMADGLAPALWNAVQSTLRPLQEQQSQQQIRRQAAERDTIVSEMDSSHPGWRDRIGEMEQLYNFIVESKSGGSMRHPKYGSLQGLLHRLISGDGRATQNAANRMRNAAQHASSVSTGGSLSGPDIQTQISKTNNRDEQFRIAWRAALSEHGIQ